MQKVIITGGAGFVGSHVVEHFLKKTDWNIVVLDKLNYASSGYDRLRDIDVFDEKRVKVFTPDLQEPLSDGLKRELGNVDYIINMASESHVDNSIADPVNFILNNVKLTINMLEYARWIKPLKFIQFSTDEVYGTAPEGVNYKEGDRFNAGNPYSASKAAQEVTCQAYANTYGLPIVITNGINIFGERQHPEKFIPLIIRKILKKETILIHANKDMTKAGSRFYTHARNVAATLLFILNNTNEKLDKIDASIGKFNIVSDTEINNLDLVKTIGEIIGKEPIYQLVDFHSSRPGHDLRYSLSGEKLLNMGFKMPKSFKESLEKTVNWYLQDKNKKWLGL